MSLKQLLIVLFSLAFCCFNTIYGMSQQFVLGRNSGSSGRGNYILSSINQQILCPNITTNMCDCSQDSSASPAHGSNGTEKRKRTVGISLECHSIRNIDAKSLPRTITHLTLTSTRLSEINETSFPLEKFSRLISVRIFNDVALLRIDARSFAGLEELAEIRLIRLPKLKYISETAFVNLPKIRMIYLVETGLKIVQGFSGMTSASKIFEINIHMNAYLERISARSFSCRVDHLKLSITNNKRLRVVEDLAFSCTYVETLNLNDNVKLSTLETQAFSQMRKGLINRAFHGDHLTRLNISNTNIGQLPTNGLQDLEELFANSTPNLIVFPHRNELPRLTKAWLTYTYHCCALNPQYGFGSTFKVQQTDPSDDASPCKNQNRDPVGYSGDYSSSPERSERSVEDRIYGDIIWSDDLRVLLKDLGLNVSQLDYVDYMDSMNDTISPEDGYSYEEVESIPMQQFEPGVIHMCDKNEEDWIYYPPIQCHPHPDLFNPCEDVLGGIGVNIASWIIALLALFGNFIVIVVTAITWFNCSAEDIRRISVSKFLILHLAIADFWMGVYVLMLSVMSTITTKRYYQYGAYWQAFGGCDVAGFLSVFSLELSVYTLSVVSAERWYAIRNAIKLDKRLTLRTCKILMAVGWIGSIVLAGLPIFGVNTYRKSAICLPLSTATLSDRVYIGVILLLYILAFVVVVTSYTWMWTIVRSSNHFQCTAVVKQLVGGLCCSRSTCKDISSERRAKQRRFSNWNNSDSRIAKRMAVLVFTDFFSFFPICLFAIFALLNMPLVSMSTTKVLLAIFFPLNSCCNPFMYAMLTKSFRKDLRRVISGSRFILNSSARNETRLQLTPRFLKRRSDAISENSMTRTARVRLQSILVRRSLQVISDPKLAGEGAIAVETQLMSSARIITEQPAKRDSRTSCSILINQSVL